MAQAAWTRDARDLAQDPAEWTKYMPIAEVSDRTKLSKSTLKDNLARPEIADKTVPRGALCRPEARIGSVPMWHPRQLTEYYRRLDAAEAASEAKLPEVSSAVAHKRGLISLVDLAAELPCALNTLRRLGRDYGFPKPVALAKRERQGTHGRQHELRDRRAALLWILHNSLIEGARDRVALSPAMLDELNIDVVAGNLPAEIGDQIQAAWRKIEEKRRLEAKRAADRQRRESEQHEVERISA